jgi:hypothetical protein
MPVLFWDRNSYDDAPVAYYWATRPVKEGHGAHIDCHHHNDKWNTSYVGYGGVMAR